MSFGTFEAPTFEEDDPSSAGKVPPDVVPGDAAVVASHLVVVEELPPHEAVA